jgi:hypothetical protein
MRAFLDRYFTHPGRLYIGFSCIRRGEEHERGERRQERAVER